MAGKAKVNRPKNTMGLNFDFYYGREAEQFAFYRIPRVLIKDKRFSGISSDAKILYGFMLDRMQLSMKNGWLDESNRVYIIYTAKEIMEDFGCGHTKATMLLAELDEKGIGLIHRVRRGMGNPDLIYVMNFLYPDNSFSDDGETSSDRLKDEGDSGSLQSTANAVVKSTANTVVKSTANAVVKSTANAVVKSTANAVPNYTNNNYTDLNYTQSINLSGTEEETGGEVCPDGCDGWTSAENKNYPDRKKSASVTDIHTFRMKELRENFRSRFDYESLLSFHSTDKKQIDEMIDLLVDVYMSDSPTVRIGREDKPREVVISRYERLNRGCIEYVLESLAQNTKRIRNPRNFLLTTLYNATFSAETYYQAEVQHDRCMEQEELSLNAQRKRRIPGGEFLVGSLAEDLDLIEKLAMKALCDK